ncbi:Uncharacterized protein FWK35_00023380 [Aphis craccivora]|uniref:Uncharacterized protein n=1 Tax=Aphis craccivora TaxID=307492 RepID=A0A6G0ZLR0_APHCR|nr:Uncharacterized protein FWK35_00023380 [Aphis craccivora]
MAGSIAIMKKLNKQKCFTYVPPTPPTELIDCNYFILDFADRTFLNVGFDFEDKTPSRYVSIYVRGFFKMDILADGEYTILHKNLENRFFWKMNLPHLNIGVSRVKEKEGRRVLFDRKNVLKLQYNIEKSIFETIAQKSAIIRPVLLRRFEIIGNYIDRTFTNVLKTIEEIIILLKKPS